MDDSAGSTVGGPASLGPDAPAGKRRYGDGIGRETARQRPGTASIASDNQPQGLLVAATNGRIDEF